MSEFILWLMLMIKELSGKGLSINESEELWTGGKGFSIWSDTLSTQEVWAFQSPAPSVTHAASLFCVDP